MKPCILAGVLASVLAAPAAAQIHLYLDAGDPTGPLPSNAYAAAAAQPGTWNAFGGFGFPLTLEEPLDALTGMPVGGVGVHVDTAAGNFTFDNPGTTGDDQALMDDIFDLGGLPATSVVTVSGLANGTYTVYTYAWAPDDPTFTTDVSAVPSSDPTQSVGGDWPGAQTLGVTYALHQVTVDASQNVVLTLDVTSGFGSLNGVQIVQTSFLPGPIGDNYCGPVVPNSTGLPGTMSAFGLPFVADNDVVVMANKIGVQRFGFFMVSRTQDFQNAPGSNGFLCIGGDIGRYNAASEIFRGPVGILRIDLMDLPTMNPGSQVTQPGETLYFQAWYRDFPLGGTNNLTDGIGITFE